MSDGNGLVEAMLGLDGFRVLEVTESSDELTITVETTAQDRGVSAVWNQGGGPRPAAS